MALVIRDSRILRNGKIVDVAHKTITNRVENEFTSGESAFRSIEAATSLCYKVVQYWPFFLRCKTTGSLFERKRTVG